MYDELYAGYGREPTEEEEEEVVSRLRSRVEEAHTTGEATPDAPSPHPAGLCGAWCPAVG